MLFSAPTALPRGWITDPDQRQKLANALAPLFEHYKDHPRILAWEIFNEPEYDIWGNKMSVAAVQATVKLLASTVHAHTTTAVTVGSATLDSLPMWVGPGLDFLFAALVRQDGAGLQCARCTDAATVRASLGSMDSRSYLANSTLGQIPTRCSASRTFAPRAMRAPGRGRSSPKRPRMISASIWVQSPGSRAIRRFHLQRRPCLAGATNPSSETVQLRANWLSPTYALPGEIDHSLPGRDAVHRTPTFALISRCTTAAANDVPRSHWTIRQFGERAHFVQHKIYAASIVASGHVHRTHGRFTSGGGTVRTERPGGRICVDALPPTPIPAYGARFRRQ